MHARGQIDGPQYLAGRGYQAAHDASQVGRIRSIDWSKTKVSGGQMAEPVTDRQRQAAARLRAAEAAVLRRFGEVGVVLWRAVLGDRRPLELTARAAGAIGEREIRACGWLLRQCLNVIAKALGIATTTRRKPQRVIEPDDPAVDPARRADAGDLADPRLRSHGNGRANGG
jgi:hypothetical protein